MNGRRATRCARNTVLGGGTESAARPVGEMLQSAPHPGSTWMQLHGWWPLTWGVERRLPAVLCAQTSGRGERGEWLLALCCRGGQAGASGIPVRLVDLAKEGGLP